jgi:hypothetical protein
LDFNLSDFTFQTPDEDMNVVFFGSQEERVEVGRIDFDPKKMDRFTFTLSKPGIEVIIQEDFGIDPTETIRDEAPAGLMNLDRPLSHKLGLEVDGGWDPKTQGGEGLDIGGDSDGI